MTSGKASPESPTTESKATDVAFDIWLDRGLHELFDEVANEPIPLELLRLIEEDGKK